MIDQMDYIVTNETSISVMSAAMGKPTIVIAPKPPYICWASHIPWFKDVHVFSKNDEKWEGAIDAAADYLRNRIERDI
jgi:ADP-heptose:LPS heptosyltransferase